MKKKREEKKGKKNKKDKGEEARERKKIIKKTKEIKRPEKKEKKILEKILEKKDGIYLSVIVPAYNEMKRLPITLVDMDKKLQEMDIPSYEIVVVNDGSSDGTAEVAKRLEPLIKNLRVVDNQENHGKGFVVRDGMLKAKGEIRIFTDADNSTTIEQFMKMKPLFDEGAQVVIGSRAIEGAELDPPQPFSKRIMGKAGNLFIQMMAVPGIWDTQCGFKAFKRTAAEDIFSRTTIDRWAFDVEALALARKLGYEIKEVPVYWKNDINSHVKFSTYFQVLWETVKIALRIRKRERTETKEGEGEEKAEEEKF